MPQQRESWRSPTLIGLSLLGLALCVCLTAVFTQAGRFPRALDRYIMTRTGEAGLYRVTYADGSLGFLTVNLVQPSSDSLSFAAVYGEGGRAVQANYHFTNWNGTGQLYTRIDTLTRRGSRLLLIAQKLPATTVFFESPVDAWPASLRQSSAAAPIEGETRLAEQVWAYRRWFDGTEAVTLPDGSTATAERFKTEWRVDGAPVDQTTEWIVPGIGQVRLEQRDGAGQPILTAELLNNTRLGLDSAASLPYGQLLASPNGEAAYFREGPARTGAWPNAALAGPDLKITYRRQFGVSVTASPVFANGLFYLADQNGQLSALDAYQATPRWQFTAGGPIVAAPAVADGVVYFGAGDKRLYALEASDGLFLWQRTLLDNVSTSPVVAGGTLYVGAEDRTLYALDPRTGAARWRFVAGDRLVSSPAVADGRVIFGADDGLVYALDAATGDLLWRFAMDALVEATPAVSDGVVYAVSGGQQVAAIDAATGEARWTARTRFGYLASPAVGPTLVYAADTGGGLHAYDRATGALAWEWFTPDDVGFVSSPLLIGGHLIGIDSNAQLYVWEAATGTRLHSLSVGDAMTASPTWTGEAVLVANGAGELLALAAGPEARSLTFTPRWQAEYAGRGEALDAYSFFAGPLWVEGTVYALLRGGQLWAIEPATGAGTEVASLGDEAWATPVERSGLLYAATATGRVVALNLPEGQALWETPLGATVRFGPAVDDHHVYVQTSGSPQSVVTALDAQTGAVVWVRPFESGSSTPVLDGDSLIVSGAALTALDPATGAVRWESDEPLAVLGSLAAYVGVVYAGDGDGAGASFLAVDAATGAPIWRREDLATFLYSRPVFDPATDTILAGTQEGALYAYAAGTGELRWRFQADAAVQASLQVRDGVVYFNSVSGNLYAVDTATGRMLNHYRPGTDVYTLSGPLLGPDSVYTPQGSTLYALSLADDVGAP